MIILALRTDKPDSEFYLFDGQRELTRINYLANRDLAATIHLKIESMLKSQNLNWTDIRGVVCYKGPGSFTGLRIGLSVGNSLAYANGISVVGSSGHNWLIDGIRLLAKGENQLPVMPEYGAEPHITMPKK